MKSCSHQALESIKNGIEYGEAHVQVTVTSLGKFIHSFSQSFIRSHRHNRVYN